MKLSMHTMAVDTFVPMLESLAALLEKAAAHATTTEAELLGARLAPDMYPLGKQVELACYFAADGAQRLMGKAAQPLPEKERTLQELRAIIAALVSSLKSLDPAGFADCESADCSIAIPGGEVLEMNGLQFLRAWALPHFYFHVVTAYDILRSRGIPLGKQDYLRQVEAFRRPAK